MRMSFLNSLIRCRNHDERHADESVNRNLQAEINEAVDGYAEESSQRAETGRATPPVVVAGPSAPVPGNSPVPGGSSSDSQ